MKPRFFKAAGVTLLAVLLPTAFGGCCTTLTLQAARGQDLSYYDAKTKKTIKDVTKAQPAAYAFLPVAAVGDVLTLPFWIGVTAGVNLGLMKPGI